MRYDREGEAEHTGAVKSDKLPEERIETEHCQINGEYTEQQVNGRRAVPKGCKGSVHPHNQKRNWVLSYLFSHADISTFTCQKSHLKDSAAESGICFLLSAYFHPRPLILTLWKTVNDIYYYRKWAVRQGRDREHNIAGRAVSPGWEPYVGLTACYKLLL